MLAKMNFPPTEECPPIDLAKQYELRYWSNRLMVSHDQLRAVIAVVGNRPADVEQHLALSQAACVHAAREHEKVACGHA